MKAIIVDDEKDSRELLANYLTKYCPDVHVVGFGDSVTTGLAAIEEHKPDILFLDIEMPYGNGFDLLEQTNHPTFETVFVTAFNNYAIQALNQSAAYYLLKPIDIDELIAAVQKIKKERQGSSYVQHIRVLLENLQAPVSKQQKIMLPTMEGFEIVQITSICYCIAEDNFTKFHFSNRAPLLICRTLKYYEDVLRSHHFLRIHRSYLINPDFVMKYSKGKGGYVTMNDQRELEVSPNKKKELLHYFET